jgi:hypothetical protein
MDFRGDDATFGIEDLPPIHLIHEVVLQRLVNLGQRKKGILKLLNGIATLDPGSGFRNLYQGLVGLLKRDHCGLVLRFGGGGHQEFGKREI